MCRSGSKDSYLTPVHRLYKKIFQIVDHMMTEQAAMTDPVQAAMTDPVPEDMTVQAVLRIVEAATMTAVEVMRIEEVCRPWVTVAP